MLKLGQASLTVGRLGRELPQCVARAPRRHGRAREIVRQLETLIAEKTAAARSPADNPVLGAASLVSTGWHAIDRVLVPGAPRSFDSDAIGHIGRGGLMRGMIHEWFSGEEQIASVRTRRWVPPHSLFIHLAWRTIESASHTEGSNAGLIVWIGRRVWPHALAMEKFASEHTESAEKAFETGIMTGWWQRASQHDVGMFPITHDQSQISNFKFSFSVPSVFAVVIVHNTLLSRSIFIDTPDDASRLWAIDLALRNPAVNAVIADGSHLRMAESRRLQLAAERGRALALLARPAWEAAELSAAATRWRVCRTPSATSAPRWIVQLLRCKHLQGRSALQTPHLSLANGGGGAWEIEYAAQGHLRLVADVVDRSDPAPAARCDVSFFRERAG